MHVAPRMSRLGTESAFEVLARARALERQGRTIIHLEIGEPDFDTPRHITEAAVEALHGGATHYGPAAGLPELREAIAEDSTRRRGVRATPEMVVVTPGGKPIMFFVILALVDEGDEVLYPNPGFPIYESMIRYIGGVPVPVRLLEEKSFELDVDQLVGRVGPKTRLIILNYPHNPTGGTIPEGGLRAIAHARSGDKGDTANVGLIARRAADYPLLVREVTAVRVARHFRGMIQGPVERFELPNLRALNFLLHGALDGGGTISLKTDAQGKVFSTALLRMEIEVRQ